MLFVFFAMSSGYVDLLLAFIWYGQIVWGKRESVIQLALKVRYGLGRTKSGGHRGLFCTEWIFWSRLQVWEYIWGLRWAQEEGYQAEFLGYTLEIDGQELTRSELGCGVGGAWRLREGRSSPGGSLDVSRGTSRATRLGQVLDIGPGLDLRRECRWSGRLIGLDLGDGCQLF